ncbi:hypothetical protein JB92DRAFT_1163562 [Gautieria morchelliformis]|nr:hypothetical protein JB92DRAFT_1163562 [Gautieria morchelliformis]
MSNSQFDWNALSTNPINPTMFATLAANGALPNLRAPNPPSSWLPEAKHPRPYAHRRPKNHEAPLPHALPPHAAPHIDTAVRVLPPSLWMSPAFAHPHNNASQPYISPTSPYDRPSPAGSGSGSGSGAQTAAAAAAPAAVTPKSPSISDILNDDFFLDVALLAREDPLATQVWKMYARTKAGLPHAQRMENLTWRMMALALRRKREEDGRAAAAASAGAVAAKNRNIAAAPDAKGKAKQEASDDSADGLRDLADDRRTSHQQLTSSQAQTQNARQGQARDAQHQDDRDAAGRLQEHKEGPDDVQHDTAPRGRRIDKGKSKIRVEGFDDGKEEEDDSPMDWRAMSRSRSRMSVDLDWRNADGSRERGQPFEASLASHATSASAPAPASSAAAPAPSTSTGLGLARVPASPFARTSLGGGPNEYAATQAVLAAEAEMGLGMRYGFGPTTGMGVRAGPAGVISGSAPAGDAQGEETDDMDKYLKMGSEHATSPGIRIPGRGAAAGSGGDGFYAFGGNSQNSHANAAAGAYNPALSLPFHPSSLPTHGGAQRAGREASG